ncbi:nucleotide pyrophosphohydrolase, partial [uncultured Bifidobacterium sp.]|uniref:nucleotide pyrophosphohydrolase n=1 Tax=uncultured Bifidobacterium sp. TaxID=165187 RepID=UPI0026213EE5
MISRTTIDAIERFTRDRHWEQYHTPENLAKSIAIEAAELLECYQWGSDARMADDDHAKDELADVLTYCVMLADSLDCDMDDIILRKLERSKGK